MASTTADTMAERRVVGRMLMALTVFVAGFVLFRSFVTDPESNMPEADLKQRFQPEQAFFLRQVFRVANAPSLSTAMELVLHDNETECGLTVNLLEHYRTAPDVFVGLLARVLVPLGESMRASVPDHFRPVHSDDSKAERQEPRVSPLRVVADMLSSPLQLWRATWYVLTCMGVAATVHTARMMNNSLMSMFFALLAIIVHHSDVLKPAVVEYGSRQGIGGALLWMQLSCVVSVLHARLSHRRTASAAVISSIPWAGAGLLAMTTALLLLSWEFGPLFLLAQMLAVTASLGLGIVDPTTLAVIVGANLFGGLLAIAGAFFNSDLVLTPWLFLAVVLLPVCLVLPARPGKVFSAAAAVVALAASTAVSYVAYSQAPTPPPFLATLIEAKLGFVESLSTSIFMCGGFFRAMTFNELFFSGYFDNVVMLATISLLLPLLAAIWKVLSNVKRPNTSSPETETAPNSPDRDFAASMFLPRIYLICLVALGAWIRGWVWLVIPSCSVLGASLVSPFFWRWLIQDVAGIAYNKSEQSKNTNSTKHKTSKNTGSSKGNWKKSLVENVETAVAVGLFAVMVASQATNTQMAVVATSLGEFHAIPPPLHTRPDTPLIDMKRLLERHHKTHPGCVLGDSAFSSALALNTDKISTSLAANVWPSHARLRLHRFYQLYNTISETAAVKVARGFNASTVVISRSLCERQCKPWTTEDDGTRLLSMDFLANLPNDVGKNGDKGSKKRSQFCRVALNEPETLKKFKVLEHSSYSVVLAVPPKA